MRFWWFKFRLLILWVVWWMLKLPDSNYEAIEARVYIRFCDSCQQLGMALVCEHCGSPKTRPVRRILDRIYEFEDQSDGQRI